MYIKWYCRVDFTSPGQFMLVVAFNFKESESNKKTRKKWNGTVVWFFMSPGQFMLVVAFNFKESKSK